MKKISLINLVLVLGMVACEPFPVFTQDGQISARDDKGKEITQLDISAQGGVQTIYVQTNLPYWMARPTSLTGPYVHPVPDVNGTVEVVNLDGWMTLRFKHRTLGLYGGMIEVTVEENKTGAPRIDEIYIWNDDYPASVFVSFTLTVIQEE